MLLAQPFRSLLRWLLRDLIEVDKPSVIISCSRVELLNLRLKPGVVRAIMAATGLQVLRSHTRRLVLVLPWAPSLPGGTRVDIEGVELVLEPGRRPSRAAAARIT